MVALNLVTQRIMIANLDNQYKLSHCGGCPDRKAWDSIWSISGRGTAKGGAGGGKAVGNKIGLETTKIPPYPPLL